MCTDNGEDMCDRLDIPCCEVCGQHPLAVSGSVWVCSRCGTSAIPHAEALVWPWELTGEDPGDLPHIPLCPSCSKQMEPTGKLWRCACGTLRLPRDRDPVQPWEV